MNTIYSAQSMKIRNAAVGIHDSELIGKQEITELNFSMFTYSTLTFQRGKL